MTDKILSNLNKNQVKAVTYGAGPLLVLAGAGSGKTRVLTYRVAWLIDKKMASPQNILLLTFTNKAANEMKERVTNLTKQVPSFAGTFHSFCAKLLRMDGTAIDIPKDFLIYDNIDQKEIIKDILNELNISPDSYKPASIASVISELKSQMLTPNEYSEFARGDFQEKVLKVYTEYEKKLRDVGALDFDDLLLKAVDLLDKKYDILSKWQEKLTHVLVDEWQDTNKIQYKLTKLLVGESKNLTAVGDASQSIYSWRGADYRNINYLIRDFSEIKIINLEQNYRSTQNILTAANSVISKNSSHPVLNLWTNKGKGEKIKIYRARSGLDEASFVVNQIESLSSNGHRFKDSAVLYRTNAQSRVLEEALLHGGIPYILVGGVRFYERKEIKDVLAYLRLLVNPKDLVSERRAVALGKRRFEKFLEFRENLPKNWQEKNTTLDLMDGVLAKTYYLDKYKRETEENLQRLENIKELRSVAAEFPNINEFLENVALVEAEVSFSESPGSLDDEKNRVTLMTLHSAKGLEFPVIFIVGMEEGLFPHSRSLFDTNQLEEERRLAYVGMTRAKDALYLTFANRRLYFGQRTANPPSRFIVDIPENLLEDIGAASSKIDVNDSSFSSFDDIVEKYLKNDN
jgi:DNA helicase-2/ATP-dependent DNA helicase PcrA